MPETSYHKNSTDQLLSLLKKQEQTIKNSNFAEARALSEQAAHIIEDLQSRPVTPKDKEVYHTLIKQYNNLELILKAQINIAKKDLQKIQRGKKTLQAYH